MRNSSHVWSDARFLNLPTQVLAYLEVVYVKMLSSPFNLRRDLLLLFELLQGL